MHTTQLVAGLAAAASLVIASPLQNAPATHQFTVQQQAKGHKFRNGAVSLAQAYRKYKATPPSEVSDAAAAALSQQGTVTATPEAYDESYLCPVTVGGNTLNLDFDTGSADLWVFSTELPASQSSGHTLYTCTGTLLSGYKWSITYGDGSGASGNVFRDKVVVGAVTATSQAVEAATSVSSSFQQDTQNDGLLGLAFSSINTVTPQQQTTFFATVQSSLTAPLFTAYLKHNAPGSYDFGFINTSKYTGTIAYANVNTANGFWQFTVNGYSIGSGSEVVSSFSGIADTGTTLLLLSSSICSAYYKQVSGASYSNTYGGYVVPCSATLPSFSVYIGSNKRTIPGTYMNYAPITSSLCYGGLQSNAGIGFSILGDIFLKSQLAVFDASVPRVGFAQQA